MSKLDGIFLFGNSQTKNHLLKDLIKIDSQKLYLIPLRYLLYKKLHTTQVGFIDPERAKTLLITNS